MIRRNPHQKAFLDTLDDLELCQRNLLQTQIVAVNAQTRYGQRFGFATISDAETYALQVPLIDYEAIREPIDQMVAGIEGVLTSERAIAFFKTSGSLSKPKLVPVTNSLMREKVSAFATFWGQVYEHYPAIKDGAMVSNFSDASAAESTEAGIEITSESGFWARRGRSLHSIKRWPLPAEIRLISDPSARLYATARLLLQGELNCIMCLNPSTLLQFCRTIELHADELVDGLLSGGWGNRKESIQHVLESEVGHQLAQHLRQAPEASDRLGSAITSTAKVRIKDLWPELDLVICWCSSVVQPYLVHLAPYIEGVAVRDYITQSSECMMAIPLEDGRSGGVLAYQSHFFEFIPESEADQDAPSTLFSWQLEEGERYELVVSTGGGLYRYRMGDCVRVTGFQGATPIIEFLYRLGKTSSMTGEKLTEFQVLDAATAASRDTGIEPEEFLCFPMTRPTPHYGLLFDAGMLKLSDEQVLQWVDSFHDRLGLANSEYKDKCESGRLGNVQACRVEPGSLLATRQARRADGVSEEQVKSEVLSREADRHELLEGVVLLS